MGMVSVAPFLLTHNV